MEHEFMTVLDMATVKWREQRGITDPDEGDAPVNGADFESVGFAIMGGCGGCGASLAAYNAWPSRTGFWQCRDCIGDLGFTSVAQFEVFSEWSGLGPDPSLSIT